MEVDIDLCTDEKKAVDGKRRDDDIVEDIIEASESSQSKLGLAVLHESQEYHPDISSKLRHATTKKCSNKYKYK